MRPIDAGNALPRPPSLAPNGRRVPRSWRLGLRIGLGLGVAALVAACGGAGGQDAGGPSVVPTGTPIQAGTSIQAAVGGTVTSDDGQLTLTIPAGALSQDSTVSVVRNTAWQLPVEVSDTFSRVGTLAYDIQMHGATWVASSPPMLKFAPSAFIAAVPPGRMRAAAVPNAAPGASDTLGISNDCPNGETTIVVLTPPPRDGNLYDPGTPLIGCNVQPMPDHVTVALVQWKQASTTSAWHRFAGLDKVQGLPTVGGSWLGGTPVAMALKTGDSGSSVVLVDGSGQLLADSTLPVDPAYAGTGSSGMAYTSLVLDGPAHFYLTGQHEVLETQGNVVGVSLSEQVVERYSLQYSKLHKAWAAHREWTYAVPGSKACDHSPSGYEGGFDCGAYLFTRAVGLALDPVTGDAVFAGLRWTDTGMGTPTLPAGGYVGRLDRQGQLLWQTPVDHAHKTTNLATSIVDHYNRLEVDPQGISYFASLTDGRLYASQLDTAGRVQWSRLAFDGAASGHVYAGWLASGMDNGGQLHLATRLFAGAGQGGVVQVVKVNASGGTGSLGGWFAGTSDLNLGMGLGEPEHLAIDSHGTVFATYATQDSGNVLGGPGAYVLTTSGKAYKSSDSASAATLQVDGSDQLWLQQVGSFDNENQPDVCSLGTTCMGVVLRKFIF